MPIDSQSTDTSNNLISTNTIAERKRHRFNGLYHLTFIAHCGLPSPGGEQQINQVAKPERRSRPVILIDWNDRFGKGRESFPSKPLASLSARVPPRVEWRIQWSVIFRAGPIRELSCRLRSVCMQVFGHDVVMACISSLKSSTRTMCVSIAKYFR